MTSGQKFWDKQAQRFGEGGNEASKKLVERSSHYLDEHSYVLDFACGTGQSSILLADIADQVLGIDYSEEMIRHATKHQKTNLRFMTGSLDLEILKNESFDFISAYNVLHLLDNLEAHIDKIHKLLKPNGYFVSLTPCLGKKSLWVKLIVLLGKIGLMPQTYPYTVDELKSKLKIKGMEIVEADSSDGVVKNTYLVLRKVANDD